MTLNKVILIGNLGSDPEMRYTPNGAAVCEFSMAVNRRYTTGDGEQREETDWFRVTSWGKLAETVNQYLQKGRKAYVEGRISSSAYTDREGQPRASLEVTAQTVQFLDFAGGSWLRGRICGRRHQGNHCSGDFRRSDFLIERALRSGGFWTGDRPLPGAPRYYRSGLGPGVYGRGNSYLDLDRTGYSIR